MVAIIVIWIVFIILSLLIGLGFHNYAKHRDLELSLAIETNHWWYVVANVWIWFGCLYLSYREQLPLLILVMVLALVWTATNNYLALKRAIRYESQKWSLIQ
ncbi:hypothetical protein MXL54_08430 [Enterobacteriaceae bacterium G50]|nr:hypothetical protein [Enterobacteriaceae bacterium G50]